MITVDDASSARMAISELSGYITGLERRVIERDHELERERQEAGRLRARVEELEAVLRPFVEWCSGDLVTPGPAWSAREALGLDGRTGHRDVNAEAGR